MSTEQATTTRSLSRVGTIVVSVLFALSLLAAGFFGVSWAVTANDESVSYAAERDEVLRVGNQGVINFNTLDHKNVERGLDRWAKSSTGALHEEVVRGRKANAERITKAKTKTEAEILDSAVTTLDDRAGKASMIAVVKVTVTQQGQQPAEKRSRYQAELTREGEQWKLSGLGPVSVG